MQVLDKDPRYGSMSKNGNGKIMIQRSLLGRWSRVASLGAVAVLLCATAPLSAQDRQPDARVREQPTIPDGWVERPFEETAVEPQFSESEQQRGFLLFQRPISEPVHPNTRPRDHERINALTGFATPGEIEPLTFSLYPDRELKNMSVRCSDLSSDRGRISASRIDVRLVTYWNIGFPRYTSRDTYRRLPEFLERVTSHTSVARECQRWWLTVRVPSDAGPGIYSGTVLLQDDELDEAVKIPVRFRVLGFPLQRDPTKHLSAYYYPRNRTMFAGRDDAFIDRATANEYRSMVEHGLDMLPTFYLQFDREQEKIVVQEAAEIDRMLAAGMKGPLPVLGGNAVQRILQKVAPNVKRGSHWQIEQMPPAEFYTRLTEWFRRLKQECQDRGWPEIICCPLDEVSASSNEFGSLVYKAVHDAGVRTYATKSPLATDAIGYRPFVDVWCSQPYALPYAKVVADAGHEYWSYPNHNAGERKNRRVMCKGGRMTYGFGFWRSGYTTLIPWHWAWTMKPDPFDYLRSPQSGAGQRIGDDGEVIPAVYWECFREGYDDARYLFTLQQASWERAGSANPECRKEVELAQAILQETWTAIKPQERYLADNVWPSSEFDARRWQLAVQIDRLLKFPSHRQGVCPSVYVGDTAPIGPPSPSIVVKALAEGKLESRDLGEDFLQWKSETPESSIQVLPLAAAAAAAAAAGGSGRPVGDDLRGATLRWDIHVDHLAGGTADGQYNVGWPRVRRSFKKDVLDMGAFDFLEVVLRVDSDRDEVQDDVTLLGLSISSHDVRRLYETSRDIGDRQREEVRLLFSIPEMIQAADKGDGPWKSLAHVQLFVAEANYPHSSAMQFEIRSVRLLRFKTPMVSHLDAPGVITLPRTSLAIPFEIMGTRSIQRESHRIHARLVDASGNRGSLTTMELDQQRLLVIDTSRLRPGECRLDVAITSGDGQVVYRSTKSLLAIRGPGS